MSKETRRLPGMGAVDRITTRYQTDRVLRNRLQQFAAMATLAVLLVWFLFPFVWTFKTSIQARPVAQTFPPVLWGFEPQIAANYGEVIYNSAFLQFMRNGILTAAIGTIVAMLIGLPHAYVLSKYDYKLRNTSMFLILGVRVFPLVALAVPFFILYSRFGLSDTLLGVTIVLTMLYEPFIVWILKSYFDGISTSMVEAARMDGCTKFQAFYRIMLPQAGPALASATIFSWIEAFNHFTLVFFLTSSPSAQTVPFGILNFIRDNFIPWNIISAASILAMVPSFIIILLFQKYLVRGIAGEQVG